jgi:iron complex outermembrane receptor protein
VIEVIAASEPPSADITTFASVYDASIETARVKTVAEALDTLPAVRVKNYGGMDLWSVAYIRGFAPNQTAVLLDGVPVNSSMSGVVNLADIPAWNVSRVEVYKGFSPSAFPVSAPGGVINIVTAGTQKGGQDGFARVGYGSFDTYSADAGVDQPLGSGAMHLSGGFGGSGGDFPYLNDHGTQYNGADDTWDLRANNQNRRQGATAHVTQKIGGWDAVISDDWFARKSGLPGIGNNQSKSASFGLERNLARMAVSGALDDGGPSLSADVFHMTQTDSFTDLKGETGLGAHDSVGKSVKTGAGVDIRFPRVWNLGATSVHAAHSQEAYDAADRAYTGNPSDPGRSRAVSRVSLQNETGAGEWIFAQSLRYERFDDQFGGPSYFQQFSVPFSSSAVHETVNPKIGFRWGVLPQLSVMGNAGSHQRVPDLTELFGDRGVVVGNPALSPESGANFDIGLRGASVSGMDGLKLTGEMVFFHSQTRNLIVYSQNSQRTSIAQNVGSSVINGVELSATAHIPGDFRASAAYTWQEARDASGVPHYAGRLLPDRPVHNLFVKAVREWERALMFYELSYEDGLYLDRANFMKNPPQAIHTAGATVTQELKGALSLTFEVKNLTGQTARDAIGYPMPGRSLFLTAEWRPQVRGGKEDMDKINNGEKK